MYIDVVPDKAIWTVNWLHYLNYEPIARTSSTRHLVRTSNNLGKKKIPTDGLTAFHVSFLSLDRSQNDSRLTVFLTEGKRVFHVSIFSFVSSGNGFMTGRLSYVQASIYCPCPMY